MCTYKKRDEAGLCLKCGGVRDTSAKCCRKCTATKIAPNHRKHSKLRREKATQGICPCCRKEQLAEGAKRCQGCTDKKEQEKKKRIAANVCVNCQQVKTTETTLRCYACLERIAERGRELTANLRNQVFMAYGGYVCNCCGETNKAFLQIDHINNDGYEQREQGLRCGVPMYRWLIVNNYPDNFQILCANCNWGKRATGVCPHKLPVEEPDTVLELYYE